MIAARAAGEAARRGVEITGLAYDSRDVAPGDLFFCVRGLRSDGHEFAAAGGRGGRRGAGRRAPARIWACPRCSSRSARAAMAPAAASFNGDPARELRVVGVTGTNGKTTTAYLVRGSARGDGVQCGLLGTVKSVVGAEERRCARTTPEAIDLQADLRAMLDGGDRACVMEVSSHALELSRVDAIALRGRACSRT